MKILLLETVENLGKAGDIVEVKDGYANNFLLPHGLGAVTTKANTNEIKARQQAALARAKRELEAAQAQANSLEGKVIEIFAKSGDQGHLFGTVTSQDIADKLVEREINVDKRNIKVADDIRTTGRYEAEVRLHPEVTAAFIVEVKNLEEA